MVLGKPGTGGSVAERVLSVSVVVNSCDEVVLVCGVLVGFVTL